MLIGWVHIQLHKCLPVAHLQVTQNSFNVCLVHRAMRDEHGGIFRRARVEICRHDNRPMVRYYDLDDPGESTWNGPPCVNVINYCFTPSHYPDSYVHRREEAIWFKSVIQISAEGIACNVTEVQVLIGTHDHTSIALAKAWCCLIKVFNRCGAIQSWYTIYLLLQLRYCNFTVHVSEWSSQAYESFYWSC